jgi:hypothetical protein
LADASCPAGVVAVVSPLTGIDFSDIEDIAIVHAET